MELTLNTNVEREQTNAFAFLKSKHAKVPLFILLFLASCGLAYAGSDDGAIVDICANISKALTGAPGKIIACGMLFSVAYFGVVKPNLGLALVSALMMLIMANGEKIISTFLDAGIPL
ncbi:pili assembly chaperone [Enterobacter hormaechei]|nr:pili assembly chaperone [Enterobacter hormaechei]